MWNRFISWFAGPAVGRAFRSRSIGGVEPESFVFLSGMGAGSVSRDRTISEPEVVRDRVDEADGVLTVLLSCERLGGQREFRVHLEHIVGEPDDKGKESHCARMVNWGLSGCHCSSVGTGISCRRREYSLAIAARVGPSIGRRSRRVYRSSMSSFVGCSALSSAESSISTIWSRVNSRGS